VVCDHDCVVQWEALNKCAVKLCAVKPGAVKLCAVKLCQTMCGQTSCSQTTCMCRQTMGVKRASLPPLVIVLHSSTDHSPLPGCPRLLV
jgi:hypothetical protein